MPFTAKIELPSLNVHCVSCRSRYGTLISHSLLYYRLETFSKKLAIISPAYSSSMKLTLLVEKDLVAALVRSYLGLI